MHRHACPSRERLRELDLDALHRATLTGELGVVLEVITGAETGEALQQVGAALVPVLTQDRERSGPVVASLHDRLTLRDARGDRELAEDLLRCCARSRRPVVWCPSISTWSSACSTRIP